jgi:hypothetical protein
MLLPCHALLSWLNVSDHQLTVWKLLSPLMCSPWQTTCGFEDACPSLQGARMATPSTHQRQSLWAKVDGACILISMVEKRMLNPIARTAFALELHQSSA